MKEPVDHVLRPQLPWRQAAGITECGFDASKVRTISREEYFARYKDLGQQRCALLTCMTCSTTAQRWGTWEDDPRKAIEREIQWEAGWRTDRGTRLRDELVAISALVEAHREEFEAHINQTEQRREWLAKKAAVATKAKPPRANGGL